MRQKQIQEELTMEKKIEVKLKIEELEAPSLECRG